MAQSYNYRARNAQNQIVTGIVQATGLDSAKKILLQNQLTPLSITAPRMFLDYLPFFNKVGMKEKTMFARQISTMIEAGLTLSQSMRLLIRQMKKGKLRAALETILNDLQDGFSFSTALAKFPDIFDPIFINVVRAGEATGKLEVVLSQLATNLEKDVKVRGKIKGALMYPIFIMVALVGVGVLMMVKVIPQLLVVFEGSNKELPTSTKLLIATSNALVHGWYWLILIGIVIFFVGRWFFRSEMGIQLFSRYSLKLPVAGDIIVQSSMARFGRLLGMLLSSSVPLLESLRLINDSFPNKLYQRGIAQVAVQVERGVPMSVPISENPVFPIMVGQMVSVGEQTGKMDEVMGRLADYYESEVESKVGGLATLIEPFVIILLGVAVAWLVIAILLPIYQISTSV
ncbi:type II secretion system F family protein [soil metagenome]